MFAFFFSGFIGICSFSHYHRTRTTLTRLYSESYFFLHFSHFYTVFLWDINMIFDCLPLDPHTTFLWGKRCKWFAWDDTTTGQETCKSTPDLEMSFLVPGQAHEAALCTRCQRQERHPEVPCAPSGSDLPQDFPSWPEPSPLLSLSPTRARLTYLGVHFSRFLNSGEWDGWAPPHCIRSASERLGLRKPSGLPRGCLVHLWAEWSLPAVPENVMPPQLFQKQSKRLLSQGEAASSWTKRWACSIGTGPHFIAIYLVWVPVCHLPDVWSGQVP